MGNTIKTRKRYQLLGCDYSAQEVRIFAASSRDSKMIKTYEEGKDLYADVASRVYGVPYEECLEWNPVTKEFNLEGKARRTKCKSLVLGLLYGRGVSSIADQIKSHNGPTNKTDIMEAKKLSEDFFAVYPESKAWIDKTHEDVRKYGFVEDLWGRRRRLPDINLPKYTIELENGDTKLNPLVGVKDRKIEPNKVLVDKYISALDKTRTKEARDVICSQAKADGLKINCNSGYIAQAERQSVNSRIQGGAATVTKLAMRDLYNDKRLTELGFHLLIPVHDEVIAEAPLWRIEEAKERMSYIMNHAAEPECVITMKTDCDDFDRWYADVFTAHAKEEFELHKTNGMSEEEAFNKVYEDNCEFTKEQLKEYLGY